MQVGSSSTRDLETDTLVRGTIKRCNEIRVARGDFRDAVVLHGARSVVEGCLRGSRGFQLGHINLAISTKSVRRCLEIGLLGEQEDKRTCLPLVFRRDVEVEDRRYGIRDGAEVGGSFGSVRVG